MAEDSAAAQMDGQEERKKGRKLLIIIGLFLFLAVSTVSIMLFAPGLIPAGINPLAKDTPDQKEKTAPALPGHIYSLEAMVLNLADTAYPRYLKIKIDLESGSPGPEEEFNKKLIPLKDAIITIITNKTYPEIADAKGKVQLKEEIALKAGEIFEKLKVKSVYFTEFLVQ